MDDKRSELHCLKYALVLLFIGGFAQAQAVGAERSAVHGCFMGDCFEHYVLSATRQSSGLIVARIRTTFSCAGPSYSCHGQPLPRPQISTLNFSFR